MLVVAFSFALFVIAAEVYTCVSLSSDFYSFVPYRRIRYFCHIKAFLLKVRTAWMIGAWTLVFSASGFIFSFLGIL